MNRIVWPLVAALSIAACEKAPALPQLPADALTPMRTATRPRVEAPGPMVGPTPGPMVGPTPGPMVGPAVAATGGGAGAVWPRGLTDSLVRVELTRTRRGEAPRSARVARDKDGVWVMEAPRRGEADPNALDRLAIALEAPQLVPSGKTAPGPVEFDFKLTSKSGKTTRLVTRQTPLGDPVPVTIEGVGDFTVSPVEVSTKLPDPSDFLPTGLWVTAGPAATSLEVKGSTSYRLVGGPTHWRSADRRPSRFELDDFPGVLVGRMVVGYPEGGLKALGLDPPVAIATLCAKERCRDFKLGRVDEGPVTRYYAVAPDADPVELRTSDGKKLNEGPWPKGR